MNKKILLVDNQPVILKLISNLLEKEGYEVKTASGSLSALEILQSYVPDVMFVDLVMPYISGDKLCQIVRTMPELADMFIIVLSAIAAESEVDFVSFGADACIAKGPFKNISKYILEVLEKQKDVTSHERKYQKIYGVEDIYQREITLELLSSRKHLEVILKNISEGIVEFTEDGKVIYANPTAVSLCGIPEEKLLATSFLELFEDEQRKTIERILQQLDITTQSIGEESPVFFGEKRVLINFLPVNEEGYHSIIAIIADITERKKTEEKLAGYREHLEQVVVERTAALTQTNEQLTKEIAERLEAEHQKNKVEKEWERTFDAIGDIVTLQDLDMRITRVNKATCRILNKSPEELVGKYCYEVFRGTSFACQGCPELKSLKDFKTHSAEIHHADINKTFLVTAAPIVDEQGECNGVAHFAKDISEMKELQAHLQQSQKMEAIGTLAGGIAHDFNNILGAILGYTELALLDTSHEGPLQETLQEIQKGGVRAKDLIAQILAFSRQSETRLKPAEIRPIIEEALKLIRATLPTTIEIRQEIESESDCILAEPTQIHQVMMNLCTNAAYAMRENGGVLTIKLDQVDLDEHTVATVPGLHPGPYLRLSISDTGVGIDKEVQKRIFEPFYTTKGVSEGTGMGLAVVHGILKDHGGAITVQSEPQKGTTFEMYFPSIQICQDIDEIEANIAPPKGHERILFVDDEESLVQLGQQVLGYLGYAVTAVNSSTKALEIFKKQPDNFDLVITDMTMPEMIGTELAKGILQVRPEVPIILCTGFSELISEEEAKKIGIREYVMKPLVLRDISQVVRNVLDDTLR